MQTIDVGTLIEFWQLEGFTKSTVTTYKNDFGVFERWVREETPKSLPQINKGDIRQYKLMMVRNGLSGRTISRRLLVVRQYYQSLVDARKILVNPCSESGGVKREIKRLPRVHRKKKVDEVQELISDGGRELYRARNIVIIELAYSCGLRSCEIVVLNLSDIGDDTLNIIGKGGKQRFVPISHYTRELLIEYISEVRPKILKNRVSDAVFPSRKSLRLTNICSILHGIEANIHGFRHGCAVDMLSSTEGQGSANLAAISKLLGHEELQTSVIYTKLEIGELKRVHQQMMLR